MQIFIRAYLRASTEEQDAKRAKSTLDDFVLNRNLSICNYYIENDSGAKLNRPELFRLVHESQNNDILLVEDIDRLSRLSAEEWEKLKNMFGQKNIRVVAVDVPTTWQHLSNTENEFDSRMFSAINNMLIDMLAAMARRDYEQRKRRQKQGIKKAQLEGKFKGRRANLDRYNTINRLLEKDFSWSEIQRTVRCSRGTISSAKKHNNIKNKT